MAKKKNKSQKPKKARVFSGSLADKLKGVEVTRAEAKPPAPAPAPSRVPEPTPATRLSDADLFEQALSELAPSDTFRGKFHGDVHNALPGADDLPRTAASRYARGEREPDVPKGMKGKSKKEREQAKAEREAVEADIREEIMFTRFVGLMDDVSDDSKYYKQKPREAFITMEPRGFEDDVPEGLITPTLPREGPGLNLVEGLDDSQKGLLNRARLWARQNDMPTLNLRGDSFDDAMRQLELFVHQQWKEGAKYVRVVHGRGLGSAEGAAVLKPAVLGWLEEGGFRYLRGYAPELTPDRDYGSLIVSLNRDGLEIARQEKERRAAKKNSRGKGGGKGRGDAKKTPDSKERGR